MFESLKRHPLRVQAHFDYSLVLGYAIPEKILEPMVLPGLTLDTFGGFGFIAIALVETRSLRPAGWPSFLGKNFFLLGYRIFVRYRRPTGETLRGLQILRSDTDSRWMAYLGGHLTHYNYRLCRAERAHSEGHLSIRIETDAHDADLQVQADLSTDAPLPQNSPFKDWTTARRFAGPMPFTFSYEPKTKSVVLIEGVRTHWQPRPVAVKVSEVTYFNQSTFAGHPIYLANAFYVENIPYLWKKGVCEPIGI